MTLRNLSRRIAALEARIGPKEEPVESWEVYHRRLENLTHAHQQETSMRGVERPFYEFLGYRSEEEMEGARAAGLPFVIRMLDKAAQLKAQGAFEHDDAGD